MAVTQQTSPVKEIACAAVPRIYVHSARPGSFHIGLERWIGYWIELLLHEELQRSSA